MAALFDESGRWFGPGIGVDAGGREAIRQHFADTRASRDLLGSSHLVSNPSIEVDGVPATESWRLLMLCGTSSTWSDGLYRRVIGSYHDQYVRKDGRWMFHTGEVTVHDNGRYAVVHE